MRNTDILGKGIQDFLQTILELSPHPCPATCWIISEMESRVRESFRKELIQLNCEVSLLYDPRYGSVTAQLVEAPPVENIVMNWRIKDDENVG